MSYLGGVLTGAGVVAIVIAFYLSSRTPDAPTWLRTDTTVMLLLGAIAAFAGAGITITAS